MSRSAPTIASCSEHLNAPSAAPDVVARVLGLLSQKPKATRRFETLGRFDANLSGVQIESASIMDAHAVRAVHCQTWAATYLALLPRGFYDQRLAAHRCRDWRRVISEQQRIGGGVVVARQSEINLVGFCQFGPSEDADDDPGSVGQIVRLYVLPAIRGLALAERSSSAR